MNWYLTVLQKYAEFEGRAQRAEYWMFFLFNILIGVVIGIVGVMAPTLANAVLGLYILGTLIPGIAVTVRRLHDTGRSGWWILIGLVPFIGGLWMLVLTVLDSQPGDNEYGPNPKGL